jgi:(1->4)-alpha-D-glucan 1-alpha-D-glucosylmutase
LWRLENLQQKLETTHADVLELQSIATALSHLPPRSGLTPEQKAERAREKEVQKRRLSALCSRSAEILQYLQESIHQLNGTVGDERSFDALHELIKAQAFRLAQWRVAADDINYRRFFDVNHLAGLRVENQNVFTATHGLVFDLIARGKVDGLRIDHVDGLYDPAEYLSRLQEGIRERESAHEKRRTYVLIEKILTNGEQLRKEWPVDGTTGYDFCNLVGGLFVDPGAASKFERTYRAFIAQETGYQRLVYDCKKLVLKGALASELTVLANALGRIALANRHTCDFTLNSLRSALAEIIASFPVYRTYISGDEVGDLDRGYIEQAVAAARKTSTAADLSVFDFVLRILLVRTNGNGTQTYRRAIRRFAMKFQQATSGVMAKGLEDTAFYRYNRLIGLNEVGGNPQKFGVSIADFHHANLARRQDWPDAMLATSTHDSKLSEDVRMRIAVLSEIPALWRLNTGRWRKLNSVKKTTVDGNPAPSLNDEYRLYQVLVGAWPLARLAPDSWEQFSLRIEQYMLKAIREAKESTSWANLNAEYEGAMVKFVRALLERGGENRFLAAFSRFHRHVNRLGMLNSLSQTLLKLTVPGVPDTYQGNELWEFNLVDPDNRRPVDFSSRTRLLDTLRQHAMQDQDTTTRLCRDLVRHMEDGRIKLFLIWKVLCTRKSEPALFREGEYLPLKVQGEHADRICAFARKHAHRTMVVVVPRLWGTMLGRNQYSGQEIAGNTSVELPPHLPQRYQNIFSGQEVQSDAETGMNVSTLLGSFPVALLVS